MQVIVTGSSGTLGFETLDALVRETDYDVKGVSRKSLPFGSHAPNLIVPEPLNDAWINTANSDAAIVHFAGLANPRVPFIDTADLWTQAIAPQAAFVERLVAAGWRGHLVYLSTGGALYGDTPEIPVSETHPTAPKSVYALQKLAVESIFSHLALQHGFRLSIVRLANPYGARQQIKGRGVVSMLIHAARSGALFSLQNGGTAQRDFVHVSDMISALRAIVNSKASEPIDLFHIGSGVGTSIIELIALIQDLTGHSIQTEEQTVSSIVGDIVLDISHARQKLDWSPQIHLRNGLDQTIAAYPD